VSVSEGRSLAEVPEGRGDFAEDDPSRCAVFIEKEQVKVTRLQVTAREAVVAILGPGDFFGEGGLAGSRSVFYG
jgi:CRP/FNR family cyclic AMP-dependent transcriptional regulator